MNNQWDIFYTEVQTAVSKKDYDRAESLTHQGLQLFPTMLDAVYLLTKVFREESRHQQAWKYYLIGSAIDDEVYTPLFLYEKTILNYYVGTPKREALLDFILFYNTSMQIGYENLEHYAHEFTSYEINPLPFPEMGDFLPTSTSILETNDGYLLNIRYVNYRIQSDASYLMMENGSLSPNHQLRTRNFCVYVTKDFAQISSQEEMIPVEPPRHDRNIHGIEDIRLFYEGGTIRFIAASCEYSHNGNIQQVTGIYSPDTYSLEDITPLVSPKGRDVEKNWIPTGEGSYIYSWYPFILGKLNGSYFETILEYDTPPFFQHMRGSSTLVRLNNLYYCMIHCMIDSRPRKYYHSLVRLDLEFKIQAYTMPLYFKKNHIEYTVGIAIRDGTLYSIVSQNDCNPILVKIYLNTLTWISIETHSSLP
jgi:hypothetical protein